MNSSKVKILTDHQEIHITFAFQITRAVQSRCVGARPLQLLLMFSLIMVFTIKNPVELAWVCLAAQVFQKSSPVTGRIVLYALNHERSQEWGPSFQYGVRFILVKSLCPWNISDTDSHMKSLCLLIHNLKIFCPCFWQINEVKNLL